MLRVEPSVWLATLEHFRRCGRSRIECVVYWVARQADPDVVDDVAHPNHVSTKWMYQVKPAWLNAFMVRLHTERRTVRVQVHTHCEDAFHSATDDGWPLVTTPGFLSLVIPRFAESPILHDDLFLAELNEHGKWHRADISQRIAGVP